ncbi:hypothetical protein LuPra_01678 [Luteitalea pratensis]|uniref:Uncharacterized protein n=1 Tax=Luteitalea pratensis TaxID=1855912 RepID=A0A143PK73_LUTPR|nr:hypothetical protein [Luteitalea pratensis]AMY08478.1 hypothetical protein LuPra_01678 [Luteitalea pratensis]
MGAHRLNLILSWTVVACLAATCAPARAAADAVDPPQPSTAEGDPVSAWPCRLLVANELLPRVQIVWERSATFRQQCARLARAGAVVFLRTATSVQIQRPAQSRIGISADGVTVAHVLVRLSADTVEHIGHEFEHVLEYLERVNLREALAHHRFGVTVSGVGYETDRAVAAGTRVAREVRDSRRTQR